MAFVKRSTPVAAPEIETHAAPAPRTMPLHIETKPKPPMPTGGVLRAVYGTDAPPALIRRAGPLVLRLASDPRKEFTIEDYVIALRTPFDSTNPQERRYRNRVRNRGTAITAFCITCQGGRKAVTECMSVTCPLWAFRLGNDPFYGRRK